MGMAIINEDVAGGLLDHLSRPGNAQHGVRGEMSLEVAEMAEWGPWLACQLKLWTHTFIADHNSLSQNCYGQWNTSLLEDKYLAQDIHLHLQGIGKFVKAMDIVDYLETPEMKAALKLKKNISLMMAQWWMCVIDYWWSKGPKGQFVDGHEREVVTIGLNTVHYMAMAVHSIAALADGMVWVWFPENIIT